MAHGLKTVLEQAVEKLGVLDSLDYRREGFKTHHREPHATHWDTHRPLPWPRACEQHRSSPGGPRTSSVTWLVTLPEAQFSQL